MSSILKNDINNNYLEVQLKNPDKIINEKICNTIRRIILSEINVYGFNPKDINIITNTCNTLDNDMMKLTISSLPLQLLNEKNNKHLNISLLINVKNNSGHNKEVNTDDCIVKVNNNIRKNMFPSPPIIICTLKPNKELSLNAIASYNNSKNGKDSNVYDAGYSWFWGDDDYKGYNIIYIEGKGQIKCEDIFNNACNIYIERVKELQNILYEHEDIQNNSLETKIIGENHTLLDLLIYDIRQNKNINSAGFKKEDDICLIYIYTNKKQNVKQIIDKSIKKLTDLFYKIQLK